MRKHIASVPHLAQPNVQPSQRARHWDRGATQALWTGPHAAPQVHCHLAAWRVKVPFPTEGPGDRLPPLWGSLCLAPALRWSHMGEAAGKARPAGSGQAPGLPSRQDTGPVPFCGASWLGWSQGRFPGEQAAILGKPHSGLGIWGAEKSPSGKRKSPHAPASDLSLEHPDVRPPAPGGARSCRKAPAPRAGSGTSPDGPLRRLRRILAPDPP